MGFRVYRAGPNPSSATYLYYVGCCKAQRHTACDILEMAPGPEEELSGAVAVAVVGEHRRAGGRNGWSLVELTKWSG